MSNDSIINEPIIIEVDNETTTCVVCNTRECDYSRHFPFCGPVCEYCFDKIRTLQETNESKRKQLDSVSPNIAKKMERNIRKRERKIERMTTIDDTEINKLLEERDNATKT